MYEIPTLPPTQKQLDYARTLARRHDMAIPRAELEDRVEDTRRHEHDARGAAARRVDDADGALDAAEVGLALGDRHEVNIVVLAAADRDRRGQHRRTGRR